MRGLSIRQPWAWYIAHGTKRVENRGRQTRYRGPLLIHASKSMTVAEYRAADLFVRGFDSALADRCPSPGALPLGAVVAVARLVDVVHVLDRVRWSDAPWFVGDYGWVLDDVRPLAEPIPWSGTLGLWSVPDELRDAALRGAS